MKISSHTLSLLLSASCTPSDAFITPRVPHSISPRKSQLHLTELSDVLSTVLISAGVGYTQRLAGRNDFKREMAQKISRGDITPQQLVEEIALMAQEINASAEMALSAASEVERLLEETREVARVLELPSGGEGSLSEFRLEEKEMVDVDANGSVESTEAALPRFAIADASSETKEIENEIDTTDVFSVEVNENVDRYEAVALTYFAIARDNELSDAKSDTHFSETYKHVNGEKQHFYEEIADDIISHGMEDFISMDHNDQEVVMDALLAEPPSIRVETSKMNEVEDALRLAQEALSFASESVHNSHIEEEETFMEPIPPSVEPPMNLIQEGIEIEANEQQTIKVGINDQKTKLSRDEIRSSPLARLLCTELGVDLADVPGTGLKGRVVADDVKKFAAAMSVSA